MTATTTSAYTRKTPIEDRIRSFKDIENGWNTDYYGRPQGAAFKPEELEKVIHRLSFVTIPNPELLGIFPECTDIGKDSVINLDWEWSILNEKRPISDGDVRYLSLDINLANDLIELTACLDGNVHLELLFEAHQWKEAFELAATHIPTDTKT